MGFQYIVKWIFTLFIISAVAACSSDSGDDGSTSRDIEQPPSILEGASGTQTFTLTLVSPVNGALSYETFNITAAEKSDYVAIQGNVTVEEGAEYNFDVTVFGDTQIEADEMFGLRFTDENGAEVSTLMGTITNDDFPNVSVSSPEVTERDVGTSRLRFEFTLTDYVVDDYTLNVSSLTDEQLAQINREQYPYVATPDVDFEAVNQEVVFKAGELTKTLEVIVSSDDIIEGDEIVFLNVTSDDINVLSEPYAKGVIRTDESPKVNGFDFTYADDNPNLTRLTEGTVDDDSQRNWKAINIAFDISQPENIKQAQMVALSILPEEEYLELIPENDVSYVSTQGKDADICLNLETDLSLDDTPCETEQAVMIEPDQERVEFTVFVQQDARRESNDTFMLTLANDQNVRFLDVPGIAGEIINDDSEELFVESEGLLDIVSLNEFTRDGGELSISEPKESGSENSLTYNVTLSLKTQIDDVFPVKYDIVPYFAKKGASLSEFTNVSGEVIEFDSETSSHDIPITVNGDGNYDGDKYIQVRFENDSIQPLIIRIVDSNPPKINIEPKGDPLTEEEGDTVINGPVYPLLEQVSDSYDDSNSGTHDYDFNLKLDQARVAITDLKYTLILEPYNKGFSAQRLEKCQDLSTPSGERQSTATTNPEAQDQDLDVTLHVEGSESYYNHGDTVTIKRGSTQVGWTLKVNNDSLIECAEYFKVGFIPEGGAEVDGLADQNGTSAIFRIDNKDGVKVSLDGFNVTEGVDESATANFNLTKAINSPFQLSVAGTEHACGRGDIGELVEEYNTTARAEELVVDLPISDELAIELPIRHDGIVEPVEDCELKIVKHANPSGIPVKYEYFNSIHSCGAEADCDYATGRITDSDQLVVTLKGHKTEGLEAGDSLEGTNGKAYPFTYVTNKPIAANVPNLTLGLDVACNDNSTTCADSTKDFTVENPFTFHTQGTLTPNATDGLNVPVEIKPDDIVEQDETVAINLNTASLPNYVTFEHEQEHNGSNVATALEYTIESVDQLNIKVEETTGCTGFEGEFGCREFMFSWEQDIEGGLVPRLKMDVSGNVALQASLDEHSNIIDPQDIRIIQTDSNGDEVEITAQKQFDLVDMQNGSTDTKQMRFKVRVLDDGFVEPNEHFVLSLSKPESSIIGEIANNESDESYKLFEDKNSDNAFAYAIASSVDKLMITIEQNINAPEPGQDGGVEFPFTYYTNLNIAQKCT